jgi:hypothetical protein
LRFGTDGKAAFALVGDWRFGEFIKALNFSSLIPN